MEQSSEAVEELFEVALACEPGERVAFLDTACAGNPELKRLVEELLQQDARAGSFLEHTPFAFLAPPVTGAVASTGSQAIHAHTAAHGQFCSGQVLLNRFVIVRFLAKGGMGEVYEAEDRLLQGVSVALKTILPHIAEDPALQQRFEREVLLARAVVHPNLCPIYDIFRCDEPPPAFLFLTMKLLPGQTLAARLRSSTPISLIDGLEMLKQLAAGLAAMHAANIVHRDIKPSNIILDRSGAEPHLYITDFGLARAHETEASISGQGLVAGTPGYIAPELYHGHPASQATDLFALGVVLHQIFTEEKPAPGADGSSVVVSSRLKTLRLPSFCAQLISDCLSGEPERRCQAFEQTLSALHLKPGTPAVWTRRRFAFVALAACSLTTGAAWWRKDDFPRLLWPLPRKRFIALLNWPLSSDGQTAPMLTSALSAIKSALTAAEMHDKDLFVISPEDANLSVTGQTPLQEVCGPLGANLVLAASGQNEGSDFALFLSLVDPVTGHQLRHRKVVCAHSEMTALPGKAVAAAAAVLDLAAKDRDDDTGAGTHSVPAFLAFQAAEELNNQPNDSGLDRAIELYKQAADLDPHFALGYARLALAYTRLYAIRRRPAALDLAFANSQRALSLDPALAEGYKARAWALELTGSLQQALDTIGKAIEREPSDRATLVWQAEMLNRMNRWDEAERIYHRVLQEHPNFWLAYHELAFCLNSQGRYREAIQALRTASLAAPANALCAANLGVEYLQVGEVADALQSLKRSQALDPGFYLAAAYTSLAWRYLGRYETALPFARKAVALNASEDTNWLELGDCLSSLPDRAREARAAYARGGREAERNLLTDPADAQTWMLLALYKVKEGAPRDAPRLIDKAELLGARDLDSQLYKARIYELLGSRGKALTTLAACFQRGAGDRQVVIFPDMQSLRKDPRYRQLAQGLKENAEGRRTI